MITKAHSCRTPAAAPSSTLAPAAGVRSFGGGGTTWAMAKLHRFVAQRRQKLAETDMLPAPPPPATEPRNPR